MCLFLYVILSGGRRVRPPPEVELLRVERKRTSKSASPLAKRDMATNLGGLPAESYIYCSKSPKLQAISLRRFGALVLHRIVAASGSLPQQNFDYANRLAVFFAQNDRLIGCFAISVGFYKKISKIRVSVFIHSGYYVLYRKSNLFI